MGQATAEKEIYQYLATNWSTTPIAYENVEEKDWAESGQPLLPAGDSDYLHVMIAMQGTKAVSVPGVCRREYGTLIFSAYVKQEVGTRGLKGYMDSLIGLFEYKNFLAEGNDLRVNEVLTQNTAATDDGWYVGRISFNLVFNRYVPET